MILNRSAFFKDSDAYSNPNHLFPIIKEQDNGDGTYVGHLDLQNMSTAQKLMALAKSPSTSFVPTTKGQVIAI